MDPNSFSKENKKLKLLGAFGGPKDIMAPLSGLWGDHGRVAPPPPPGSASEGSVAFPIGHLSANGIGLHIEQIIMIEPTLAFSGVNVVL